MLNRGRLVLAAQTCVLALLLTAGDAAANGGVEVGSPGTIRAEARTTFTEAEGNFRVICDLTLTLSLHRSIAKVTRTLAGFVTGGRVANCSGGTLSLLTATMPWHITYVSFTGTLPSITSVRLEISQASVLADVFFARCLYKGLQVTTVGNPVTSVRTDEAPNALLFASLGGFGCPSAARVLGTLRVSPSVSMRLVAAAPPPPVYAVALGESYLAGEGGRWAGNVSLTRGEDRIDALRSQAYWDEAGGETTPLCHRSRAAEIRIGDGVTGINYACSGATTATRVGPPFKPGLDESDDRAGRQSQIVRLREFARAHPREIKLVVVSIGGNNFGFGDVVAACVRAYLWPIRRLCSQEAAVTEKFNAANVAARKTELRDAFRLVARAMSDAGYEIRMYKLVVQNYMSPIPDRELRFPVRSPEEDGSREGERGENANEWDIFGKPRQRTAGCGIYDEDVRWANDVALRTINDTVSTAANETGLLNMERLDVSSAFNGRRLCERGLVLVGEGGVARGDEAPAVDRVEWITQIRIRTWFTEYFRQESLHPNYWGEGALRNCLRQVYVRQAGGRCGLNGPGVNARGEPNMRVDP